MCDGIKNCASGNDEVVCGKRKEPSFLYEIICVIFRVSKVVEYIAILKQPRTVEYQPYHRHWVTLGSLEVKKQPQEVGLGRPQLYMVPSRTICVAVP